MKIYISYPDGASEVAQGLADFFESNGNMCFRYGRDFPENFHLPQMISKIMECDCAVLVATDEINTSERVCNEIQHIIARNKRLVLFCTDKNFGVKIPALQRCGLEARQTIKAFSEDGKTVDESDFFGSLGSALGLNVATRTQKIFDYLPESGAMYNPEDMERNVSFRTDTFINLIGEFYDKIKFLAQNDVEVARKTFYEAGHDRGASFAQNLLIKWRDDGRTDYEDLLKKWCKFDSQVGWGRFSIRDIYVSDDKKEVRGFLEINNNFIVDRIGKRFLCDFIRGYCDGVIETLLDIKVKLVCQNCPTNGRFNNDCVFEIQIDE